MTIEERLEKLKGQSKILEPNTEQRKELRDEIVEYTEAFIDGMEGNPSFFMDENHESPIKEIVPVKTYPLSQLLDATRQSLDWEGINPASGGHLGYIPGGGIYLSSLADYWAAITNRYAGVFYANPGAVRIENQMIRWMLEKVGYPASGHGNLTSGGSIANLIGVVVARQIKKVTASKIENSVIYLTRQVHHSISKALQVAALHECQIRYVEMDKAYRMDMGALRTQIQKDQAQGLTPFLLIGSAGTTDVGAIDPMDAMADMAEKYNMWFHVDAAYGGFFVITEEGKRKFKGIERSHSVTIDPHKGMFLPYGLGISLVRNKQDLLEAFQFQASYLQDISEADEEINPMDVSPEMTKHFRGLRMWLPLMIYGEKPFVAALDEKLLLAKYFYQKMRESEDFEVDREPELSVVTFRYITREFDQDRFNRELMAEIHKDGRVFFSSTTIDGKFTLRLAILAYKTHKEMIDLTIEVLREKAEEIKNRWQSSVMSEG